MTSIYDTLLKDKPAKVLVYLKNKEQSYSSELASNIDTTYSHVVKVVKRLEELDLVEKRKSGRKQLVTLTEKGEELADPIIEIRDIAGEPETIQIRSKLSENF